MQEFMIIIIQDRVYDILVKDSGLGIEQSCLKIQIFLCTRNWRDIPIFPSLSFLIYKMA